MFDLESRPAGMGFGQDIRELNFFGTCADQLERMAGSGNLDPLHMTQYLEFGLIVYRVAPGRSKNSGYLISINPRFNYHGRTGPN